MASEALKRLIESLSDSWPNDKDLISTRDFLKIQAFGGYYLLADEQGYLGYIETIEDLKELIHEQSINPGSLRRRTDAPVHKFKQRVQRLAKEKIDDIIGNIDI